LNDLGGYVKVETYQAGKPDGKKRKGKSEMTNKMTTKIGSVEVSKVSLTERVRQMTSAAMVAGTLLIGGSALAAVPRQSSVVERAVAVQGVMKEKIATDANAAQKLPRAQVLLAQWGNGWGNAWSNWNNWDNWRNWNNWGNFGNWINY
jgi:hypothetical protein